MANEYFEFVNQDRQNANLVQFYTHTVNNALYINFTLLNDDNLEWINSIAANNRIGFFQENVLRGSSKILAAFDSEHGFRVETAPNPELVLGQYYEVKFDEEIPPDQIPTPPENRGWSPIYEIEYLTFDDPGYSVSATATAIFCFRLSDWQSGIGQKPSTGYVGVNGIVADVNNAAILTLPQGPSGRAGVAGAAGSKWTSGDAFPASPNTNDMHLFNAAATGLTGYVAADGSTAKTDAVAGEVARYNGSAWQFVMVLSTDGLGSSIFVDMHDGLRNATAEDYGKVGIGPDGKLYRVKRTAAPGHDAAGSFNAYSHAQYRGVAHNRPSNPQVNEIYYNIRVHQWYLFFLNQVVATIDAQPITAIQALGANTVWLGEVDNIYQARHAIQNFDNTKAYYAVWNETLYVLDNSTYTAATTGVTYTYRWVEAIPDDIVTKEEFNALVMNKLLPDLPVKGSRNKKIARFNDDELEWQLLEGQGLTPQQKAQFDSLVAKTADLLIETRETWVAATDASFLALAPDNAQLARVRAGNVPQGLTGWTTDVTTTDARVVLIRVPITAQLADYRILLGDDNEVRLDTYAVNAIGTQYAYMTSTSLILQEATRIRLQHHGTATHTRFIGMLADAIMARLLPLLPDENDRDGKVPRFSGNNLVWEILTGGGGGLTTSERARLLPNIPDAGERNLKIAQFVNDVLTWKLIEGFITEDAFRDYRPHTPARGNTLPVRLEPQGTFVLESTSHWSDKLYGFYLAQRDLTVSETDYRDVGTIEIPISDAWTVFEDDDNANPAIFSATRVAGIVMRSNLDNEETWQPKIIMDRALFPSSGGSYDYSGLSIRMALTRAGRYGTYHHARLLNSAFDADGDVTDGTVTEIAAGGRTYVCFVLDNRDFNWIQFFANAHDNNVEVAFQILKSKSASVVFPPTDPQFLSDDPATAWVDGTEFVTGLYEGDANGHPVARILPPLDTWNHVVARSNTYFSGTSPDAAAGVDGQFWANLRNGQIHQKQSGTWTLITDLALQTEISRATAWSTIPNNTSIPADFMASHSGRYFGAKLQHVKTSGSSDPTGDATNWIELSNETAVVGADGRIIFTTGRPANNAGKIGDIAFRRLSTGSVSLYEKTGAEVWTYRYDMLLLPPYPSTGSRDDKIIRFNGNVLQWEDLAATGSSAQTRIWADIPNNESIPLGTLVNHGGLTFAAIATHNKIATGPDGDSTNWIAVTNYGKAWSAKFWPIGVIVTRSGNPYISTQLVTNADVAPDHASNTKWLRLNTDLSTLATKQELADVGKAVFAELGISASITIPQEDGTAIPLTYASTLLQTKNSSGVIGRATAGNAITLKAGAYRFDVDVNVSTADSGQNSRSNIEFTIYNGSTLLKTKRGGYLRSLNAYNEQVANAVFTLDFSSDSTIQIRVKFHDNDAGDPPVSTQAGGSVTVTRIGA